MYLKFAIIQSVLFILIEVHMQTEIPKYETYQTGFYFYSLMPPPPHPGWTLGVVQRSKFKFFWNMDMLHIKLKKIAHASNMVENVNP